MFVEHSILFWRLRIYFTLMLTIRLERLKFFAYHGLFDLEKKIGNEFEVNCTLTIGSEPVVIEDFSQTINYTEIYSLIKSEMAQPRLLLETFLTETAEKIKKTFPRVKNIKINIYKITVPIEGFDGKIGVELARSWD